MITYEIMLAAVKGDLVAAEAVLEHFDAYINRLCTHAFMDEGGRVSYGVDTQRKTYLQGRLLAAMMRFEL